MALHTPPTRGLPPELWSSVLSWLGGYELLEAALVSKAFNSLATAQLYGRIDIVWTSRPGKALLRVLESRPAYRTMVRSLSVSYPRLSVWADFENRIEREADSQWEQHLRDTTRAGRILPYDPMEEQDWRDRLDEQQILEDVVEQAMDESRLAENADWWDEGADGNQPRRQGAQLLLGILGRLPRLAHLRLHRFDWGFAFPGEVIPVLPLLEAVRFLELITGAGIDRFAEVVPLVLARVPNVEELTLHHGVSGRLTSLPPSTSLRRLHTLRLSHLTQGDFDDSLFRIAGARLQHLRIDLHSPSNDSRLVGLLTAATNLKTLALFNSSNGDPKGPSPAMLSFIFTSSLEHLFLVAPASHSVIDALPESIKSLRLHIPSGSGAAGQGAALAEAKRTRLHSLTSLEFVQRRLVWGELRTGITETFDMSALEGSGISVRVMYPGL